MSLVRKALAPNSFLRNGFDGVEDILINLTTALVASRIHGIGAQFNWNLGDFSVNKGKGSSPEADQVEWFLKLARDELEFIGKDTPYYQTWNQ